MIRKLWCVLCCLLLATATALAELPATTAADFFLFQPEDAQEMNVVWQDGPGEPRVVLINIPETYLDSSNALMEASPVWRTDLGACDVELARSCLTGMGCAELPELPTDMIFEGVCFWVEGLDFAALDEEEAAFMLLLARGSVALNGPVAIDTSLRMGFYDADTGTLLMATWVVE